MTSKQRKPTTPAGALDYATRLRSASKPELISACMELARAAVDSEQRVSINISNPESAAAEVRDLGRLKTEQLVGLYLDSQNCLICRLVISAGSLNTTRTHPREILRPAILNNAAGFILAHNHPSGCLDASPEDVEFTKSVRKACDLLGIDCYDHLIVTRDGFTSMRQEGQI